MVLSQEEKIGGAHCINSCELLDVGFKYNPFTWWNGRTDGKCIFERLDRVLTNQLLLKGLGNTEVEHLSRTGSDHSPLLISIGGQNVHIVKPFKFLKHSS